MYDELAKCNEKMRSEGVLDIFVNCNWVDTRWQYTFTHKQYIEQQNERPNNKNNKNKQNK
jgi:hypothetical protein